MNWEPTTLEHIQKVHPQSAQVLAAEELGELASALPDNWLMLNARTGFRDGSPVAIFGHWPFWPGVTTLWALLSQEALTHGAELNRGGLRFLHELVHRDGLHRVQAFTRVDHPEAGVWLRRLGFEREGLLDRLHSSGASMYVYGKVY